MGIEIAVQRSTAYSPGTADSPLAKRYGNLAGAKIKTVGEAFADFTAKLGHPINALYKSAINDLVGTTHLITVTARFKRDAIWSLGLLTSLDLILKNYPEKDIAEGIRNSLVECNDMDLATLQAEAKTVSDWAQGKTEAEIAAALSGEGDSPIAVMEKWVGKSMGKSFYTACNDSDQYFATRSKLDMVETLMKEVEIREKKRMAQRLEDKAAAALAKAERDEKFKEEE